MSLTFHKEMNKYLYQRGLIYCSACDQFLSLDQQATEVEVNPKSGQLYHSKRFCIKTTMYASRLRLHSRGRKARTERQEKAKYY